MSGVSSPKGQFEPIHSAHAIEQVIFTLQFERSIDESIFSEVRKTSEQFKPELPGLLETPQGFPNMLSLGMPAFGFPGMPGNGFMLRRVAPSGLVENELRVTDSSLTFRNMTYSRWNAVWSQANSYFKALVPIFIKQTRVSGISINYVDKFAWSGNITAFNPNLLLRAGSKYLCPHVLDAKDLWHSHTGAFIRVDKHTKRLLNVNVDVMDENRLGEVHRIVSITTVLTDLLNQPGYETFVSEESDVVGFIDTHMQGLHAFGKEVFGNIINDEMSKRIALIE